MYGLLLTLHLFVCLSLVAVVLVQSGTKGGGLAGGAFGGSAQTVFGGRGANDFITRATIVLGVAFFATSLTLSMMSSGGTRTSRSLVQEAARRAQTTTPPTVPSPGTGAPPVSAPATGAPATSPPQGQAPAPIPPGGNK